MNRRYCLITATVPVAMLPLMFFSAWLGLAQNTPIFPGAVASNSDLFIGNNSPASTLATGLSSSGTTATVLSGTGYSAPSLVAIDSEILAVCQVSGTTLTFGRSGCPNADGRGFDGTTATSHVASHQVQNRIVAWQHNQVASEVESIEGTLNTVFTLAVGATAASSDNTAAYSAAFAAMPANGGTLLLPPATVLKGSFVIPPYPKSIRILCSGENATILQPASANTPLLSLSSTVANFSSPKIEFGNCGVQAHPSGSTGAMFVLDGMLHPFLHDLTYLSNGSGNYAKMFSQSDQNAGFTAAFGADIERITITNQSGPTNVATTIGNSSINQWINLRVVGNTGMTSVFNFTPTSSGGNAVIGLHCEGNLSAKCVIPGSNYAGMANYYENDYAYFYGNGGNKVHETASTFSSNTSGSLVTCPFGENGWIFDSVSWGTGSAEDLVGTGGCVNPRVDQGGAITNLIIGSMVGGITTSPLGGGPGVFSTFVGAGGSLAAGTYKYRLTSTNAAGETAPGGVVTVNVASSGSLVAFSLNPLNGAVKYNLYGRNCDVTCGYMYSEDNSLSQENGWLVDLGTATPGGTTPPSADSTGNVNVHGSLIVNGPGVNTVTDTGSTTNTLAGTLPMSGPGSIGSFPWPAGFTVNITAISHAIIAGQNTIFNLNGSGDQAVSSTSGTGHQVECSIPSGTPLTLIWNGSNAWYISQCGVSPFSGIYLPSETGANNAIATPAGATALVSGLIVTVQLSHSLQVGANTFAFNGGSAVAIKSHRDPTADIATGYTSSGVIQLQYSGSWLDLSQ